MKKIVFLALSFVFLVLWVVLPAGQMADERATNDVKINGTSWFWFGQAVIDSAQSAVCSFWYGLEHGEESEEIVVVNQDDLFQIKAFVGKRFFKQFDFSPVKPDHRSIRYENTITLYSTRVKPDGELPIYDKVLVHIPISDQTTGGQYDDIVKEYHGLIKSITNKKKEKKWWHFF